MEKSDFVIVQTAINALNESNSSTSKLNILKQYGGTIFADVLFYTYNPFLKFNVTSNNLKKVNLVAADCQYDLFELLDILNDRTLTGHNAIALINAFIRDNSEFSDIIYNIIDRNLKTRVDASLINRAIPGLIPVFDVALANKYDFKKESKLDFNRFTYHIQRKLDGCRCLAILDGDTVFLLSRNGREFETLDPLKAELRKLNLTGWVLDGEICKVDEDGNDDFHGIMKEISRKNHQIKHYKYFVFDMIPVNDFAIRYSPDPYVVRYNRLFDMCKSIYTGDKIIPLPTKEIHSIEDISTLIDTARIQGWEGLILRNADAPYHGKRSDDILKIKDFKDAEYKVIRVEVGPFRVIEDGVEVEEEMLTNVVIKHRGNEVSVGSGFSLDQRRHYYKFPNELVGQTITVKYFEETVNKAGDYSLRFPTLKTIFNGKREI